MVSVYGPRRAGCGVSNFLTVKLGGMLSDQAGDGWFISVPRWEL